MSRRFIQRTLLCAFFLFAGMLALDGVIFLLSHVPPSAVNLDRLIVRLGEVHQFVVWPRKFLRNLWPGEATPIALNYLLPVLNYLAWGLLFAGLKELWNHVKK